MDALPGPIALLKRAFQFAVGHPDTRCCADVIGMSILDKFAAFASINASSKKENHRSFGRAYADSIDCDRGQALDISRTGMRLQAWRPWSEGERRTVMLSGVHLGVTLTARCVWVRRLSRFKHVMGLEFEGLNDATEIAIRDLMHVAAPSAYCARSGHKTEVDHVMDDMKTLDAESRMSA